MTLQKVDSYRSVPPPSFSVSYTIIRFLPFLSIPTAIF
jgi:hypothetical protein